MRHKNYIVASVCIMMLFILVLFVLFPWRIDFSVDKRYSLSSETKSILKKLDKPLQFNIYLGGDVNPAFLRLRRAVVDIIADMERHSPHRFYVTLINPAEYPEGSSLDAHFAQLSEKGLIPTEVFMKDGEGKSIRKMIFPWLEIMYGEKQVHIPLLVNLPHLSGEENIHASVEHLEYKLAGAVRRMSSTDVRKIAFLEGFGELNEAETYRITYALSQYFQVDRGNPGLNAGALSDYEVLIVASPTEPFNESIKYILDQYLMGGGKIVWLVDGVYTNRELLETTGRSPAIALDLNLSDMFFRYGIRIEPVILQDLHSSKMPINISSQPESAHFEPVPWLFGPLLLTSNHPITQHLPEVKSAFPSTVTLLSGQSDVTPSVLLASSGRSRLIRTPSIVELNSLTQIDPQQFQTPHQPVAVLLEGIFSSAFTHRMKPTEVVTHVPFKAQSVPTAQLFIACGDIIRNETSGIASDSTTLPLGFDRYANVQMGNEEFLVNAINYVSGQADLVQLRAKTLQIRLIQPLTKQQITTLRCINVVIPLLILILFGGLYRTIRKRRFGTKITSSPTK